MHPTSRLRHFDLAHRFPDQKSFTALGKAIGRILAGSLVQSGRLFYVRVLSVFPHVAFVLRADKLTFQNADFTILKSRDPDGDQQPTNDSRGIRRKQARTARWRSLA